MPRYNIIMSSTREYSVIVEAKDVEEAREKAYEGDWVGRDITLDEINHDIEQITPVDLDHIPFGEIVFYEGKQYRIASCAGEFVALETLNGNDRILITTTDLKKIL